MAGAASGAQPAVQAADKLAFGTRHAKRLRVYEGYEEVLISLDY